MNAMSFDTLAAAEALQNAKFSPEQASAIAKVMASTTTLPDIGGLATKADVADLGGKIASLDAKITMLMWFIGLLGVGAIALKGLHLA